MKTDQGKMYTKPTLTRHGSVAQLTHGNSSGTNLDADFASGTSFGDLTFS